MSRSSPAWKRDAFKTERDVRSRNHEQLQQLHFPHLIKRSDGWILFGPFDVRNGKQHYPFALQMLYEDRQLRVRVACKYMTLPQAWSHCAKGRLSIWDRNKYRQAATIIQLMVLQAQAYGLIPSSVKFDSSIVKPKRRS